MHPSHDVMVNRQGIPHAFCAYGCADLDSPCIGKPENPKLRDPLLVERASTHGSFADNAERSQTLKAMFSRWGSDGMHVVQREALDMIALKLSRILSGQASFKDHWDDLAGYAKLASEVCEK